VKPTPGASIAKRLPLVPVINEWPRAIRPFESIAPAKRSVASASTTPDPHSPTGS
jgi:hypothetical protein